MLCNSIMQRLRQLGLRRSRNVIVNKKICNPKGRPHQKLWHFDVSKFLCAFYARLINLDIRFVHCNLQISQKRTKTGGHNSQMT